MGRCAYCGVNETETDGPFYCEDCQGELSGKVKRHCERCQGLAWTEEIPFHGVSLWLCKGCAAAAYWSGEVV